MSKFAPVDARLKTEDSRLRFNSSPKSAGLLVKIAYTMVFVLGVALSTMRLKPQKRVKSKDFRRRPIGGKK